MQTKKLNVAIKILASFKSADDLLSHLFLSMGLHTSLYN